MGAKQVCARVRAKGVESGGTDGVGWGGGGGGMSRFDPLESALAIDQAKALCMHVCVRMRVC